MNWPAFKYVRSNSSDQTTAIRSRWIVSRFFSLSVKVRNQYWMGFIVLSACFCINTQLTWLSQMSVSKVYSLLLFGTVSTGKQMSFSLSLSNDRNCSWVRGWRALDFVLRMRFESDDTILAKLATKGLKNYRVQGTIRTLLPCSDLLTIEWNQQCGLPLLISRPYYMTWVVYLTGDKDTIFNFSVKLASLKRQSTDLVWYVWPLGVSKKTTISSK